MDPLFYRPGSVLILVLMKPILLLGVMAAATAGAQTLTRGERDYAMSHLHATRKMFLDAIAALSEQQWRFKPAPDRWSIAECAEHVLLTEDAIFDRVQRLLKTPAEPDRKPGIEDEQVYRSGVDRTKKQEAPAALRPQGRWRSPAEVAEAFKQRRDRTIAYVASTQDPLRRHFDGPGPEALDAYQWLILLAAHTERHVAQIEQIKSEARYPQR